jgi:hypothetical protein
MKKYKVVVTESVIREDFTVVEAESEEEAEEMVKTMWQQGEVYFDDNQTEIVGDPELLFVDACEVEEVE